MGLIETAVSYTSSTMKEIQLQLGNYVELLEERRLEYKKAHHEKIEHEFQEVGIEMASYFGKGVWWLFYKHDLESIKKAFAICKKNDTKNINYLLGCLKRGV